MPVSRRRHDTVVLEIHAEREKLRHELAAAIERAERAEAQRRTMARQVDQLTADLASQARQIRAQQRQLDDALGVDGPAVPDREPGEVAP